MPVNTEEFVKGIAILADKENMRVTLKKSGKGAAVCGAMCFVGGLIGGPVGMAIGGTVGGVTAYRMNGQFKSVGEIIRSELTLDERERLTEHIVNSVREVSPTDAAMLLTLIIGNPSLKQQAIRALLNFVSNELRYTIAH